MNKSTPTIVIASEDVEAVRGFQQASISKGYNVLVERGKLQAIRAILEHQVICLVLDLECFGSDSLAFMNIVKKIRPRLPIVVLSAEEKISSTRMLAEFGTFYRGVKPLSVQEIEHVVEGVDSNLMRNKDYLYASL